MIWDRSLRVGVIGSGVMGTLHARVYSEMKGVRLVGVADANADRASEVAVRFDTRPFADYRALLDTKPDAVTIAVPTSQHLRVALDTLEAGVGLLIEKPIAATV